MKIFLVLLFIILFLLSVIDIAEKNKHVIFRLLSLIFFTTALVASESSKDYLSYHTAFSFIEGYKDTRFEPTFSLIVKTIKIFSSNSIFLFATYAIIGVFIKFFAIKKLTNLYFLSLLIYLSNYYLLHEINQIRAGVASGILLLSIKPLYERNSKLFFLSSILAISFHYSAIIILPLWFLNPHKLNRNIAFIIIPLSYLLVLNNITLGRFIELIPIDPVQRLYIMYSTQMEKGLKSDINIFNTIQLLRCLIALIMVYFYKILEEQNKYSIILLKIYITGIVTFVLFSDFPTASFRISAFLLVVEIILIPLLIYMVKQKRFAIIFPVGIGAILIWLNLFHLKVIL